MKSSNNKFTLRIIIALILTIVPVASSLAQSFFRYNWDKTYDVNLSDKIHTVLSTTDGYFILAGETNSATLPGQKIFLVKLNSNGELVWQKSYGNNAEFQFISITKSSSGGFYLLGKKQMGSSNPLIWVAKTDKDGNLVWENTAGGGGVEIISDLIETSESGVFLCGSKEIKGNNDTDGWLVKFNKKGALESQVLFGKRYINDEFCSITPDYSGGFFLAGYTSEKLGSEKIPYLLRIDFRGNKTWEKSYPEFPGAIPSAVYVNSEGLISCLMNVYSPSGSFNSITKIVTDPSGSLINSYSTKHRLNIDDNSYAIAGNDQLVLLSIHADDPSAFSDKYIAKLDKAMNPIWIKPLEMDYVSMASVHPIDNSNYISVGWTGRSNYKLDIKAFSFRDYSDKLIESFVIQKLIALAGMNVNENIKDFKTRIGSAKFETYLVQYESEAITSLRLIPDSYASGAQTGGESRPSIIAAIGENPANPAEIAFKGKYYALLIAIEDYKDPLINDLDKPLKDAQKLFDVLVNQYLFEKANVIFLKNPNREEIISALDKLEKEVTKSDNLLIFYAGHGYWNETSQKGFWLPSDASKQNTSNWIGNSSVSDYIRSIPAKHTLLIADACFSGSIFKTRSAFGNQDMSAKKLYGLDSRKAMTSGTLTEVPDKSVFIEFLVKRLYENQDKYLPSEQLFFSFKPAVLNNTESIPQYGVVGNAGDEGGDFIFMKRK